MANVDQNPEQFWDSTNTLRSLYTGNGGTGEEFDAWLAQVPHHLRGEARLGEPSDSQVLTALRAWNGRPGLRLDDFMPEQIRGMRAVLIVARDVK